MISRDFDLISVLLKIQTLHDAGGEEPRALPVGDGGARAGVRPADVRHLGEPLPPGRRA